MIKKYLWEGKRPKIAYDRLIRNYHQGGLKLADLESKNTALKAKWIQVNHQEDLLLNQLLQQEIKIDKEYLRICNFSVQDIVKITQDTLSRDLLVAWAKVNYHRPSAKSQVLKQVIWYNSHLKSKGEMLFTKSWYKKGIIRVEQLFTNTGELLSCKQLQDKYGSCINIIDYVRIIKTIPKEWVLIIQKGVETVMENSAVDIIKENKKCVKLLYETQIDKKKEITSKIRFYWENLFQIEILDKNWNEAYSKVMKITNCTKLRFFQYRLMNKYIITNYHVNRWNSSVSDKCTFCKEEVETYSHLFVTCKIVMKLWNNLKRWLKHFSVIDLEVEVSVILLNMYKDSFSDLVNMLLLITKYFIYAQRSQGKQPTFTGLITQIAKYKRIEYFASRIAGKTKIHEKKWLMYDMM